MDLSSPPPNPMQSRPRILNGDMTHNLYTLLEEAPEMYLSEIQDWIALIKKVHISISALHQNIRDARITYKLLHRAAAERDKDFWQEWKEGINAHFTASQMIFVDETSKDERTIYQHYCYGSTGPSGYRGSGISRMTGSRVLGFLGRIGPSVNSGASMSGVEVQGFWKDQLVIDC